jgi:hypothetical protein
MSKDIEDVKSIATTISLGLKCFGREQQNVST